MTGPFHLHIEAIDTLMFRDGRPFNQTDEGASEAVSVFPPYPPTVVGAVRAAFWKSLNSTWPSDGCLGNGTNWQNIDVLGPLSFGAPLLVHKDEPVFPMPLHIVESAPSNREAQISHLSPGPALECDLGKIHLPCADEGLTGIKTIDSHWVTAGGMTKILAGGMPNNDDLVERDELWRAEPRVGIGLNESTRTTTDGQLYMAAHVRMAEDVHIYVRLDGCSIDGFEKTLQPLAGEHRMALIAPGNAIALPDPPEALVGRRYCAIQLSPMVLDTMPKVSEALPGLPGKLVSACLDKSIAIGGWDSQARRPILLRQAIPSGSVWFFEDDDGTALTKHGVCLGVGSAWGFGQVLIGKW